MTVEIVTATSAVDIASAAIISVVTSTLYILIIYQNYFYCSYNYFSDDFLTLEALQPCSSFNSHHLNLHFPANTNHVSHIDMRK